MKKNRNTYCYLLLGVLFIQSCNNNSGKQVIGSYSVAETKEGIEIRDKRGKILALSEIGNNTHISAQVDSNSTINLSIDSLSNMYVYKGQNGYIQGENIAFDSNLSMKTISWIQDNEVFNIQSPNEDLFWDESKIKPVKLEKPIITLENLDSGIIKIVYTSVSFPILYYAPDINVKYDRIYFNPITNSGFFILKNPDKPIIVTLGYRTQSKKLLKKYRWNSTDKTIEDIGVN